LQVALPVKGRGLVGRCGPPVGGGRTGGNETRQSSLLSETIPRRSRLHHRSHIAEEEPVPELSGQTGCGFESRTVGYAKAFDIKCLEGIDTFLSLLVAYRKL